MYPDVGGECRDGHGEGGKNKLRMACRLEKDLGLKILTTRAESMLSDVRGLLPLLTLITYVNWHPPPFKPRRLLGGRGFPVRLNCDLSLSVFAGPKYSTEMD